MSITTQINEALCTLQGPQEYDPRYAALYGSEDRELILMLDRESDRATWHVAHLVLANLECAEHEGEIAFILREARILQEYELTTADEDVFAIIDEEAL